MHMDLKDKQKKGWIRFFRSFSYAFAGIKHVVLTERNMRIHLAVALLVIICGFVFSIATYEWLVILLLIGGVFVLEMINSALERVVDLVTKEYHPLAKHAKDIAAGAVLIYAILSVIIGVIIFLPKMIL